MALKDLKIWCSPMTGKIYAGYVKGNTASHKIEITDEVISAVAEHLDREKCKYEMGAGVLTFIPAETEVKQ